MLDPSNRHASVVVANLSPEIEGGKFPAKRVVGERLEVQADIFKDGHDQIAAVMLWRAAGKKSWHAIPMTSLENDRWGASMIFDETGEYEIRVKAWSDDFDSWLHDFERRLTGDQSDFTTEVEEGRLILIAAAKQALEHRASRDAEEIEKLAETVAKTPAKEIPSLFEGEDVLDLVHSWPNTSLATESDQKLKVVVETHRSLFSSWYEFFPRSAKGSGTEHSTFNDCLERVKDAAEMGFDVVYLPPIHPIGLSHRKGKNNTLDAGPDDVGSPWAIGGKAGGHLAVEPALGTLMDFQKLVEQARDLGVEVALDFAINCSPDHPYVNEHPDWFYQRPDGTIKYAENPPKKYQDIYPLNFHGESWNELWEEMLRVVRFWISSGVRIFRVDNPHTKPVSFWHWLISEIHKTDPDIIFLSEAFTKPKMMQALAKIGFTQSYTYFTWRETKAELTEYVTELTKGEMRDYYRANFWPNTPDILPFHLQNAPKSAFEVRCFLAATLSSNWGMYSGYEHIENQPLPGREEYLDSEKFQLKERDWEKPGNIKGFIGQVNRCRKEHPALQEYANIEFVHCDNEQVIGYYKRSDDGSDLILCFANLDFNSRQESSVHLNLEAMGLDPSKPFTVKDLIYNEVYEWRDSSNFVSLDPTEKTVHLFHVTQ